MRRTAIRLLVLMAILSGACGPTSGEEVTGIVVDVRGDLEDIEQFTVLANGERMEFGTTSDGDYSFGLGHLRDHLRSGEPVVVRWEERGDRLVATFIDDG